MVLANMKLKLIRVKYFGYDLPSLDFSSVISLCSESMSSFSMRLLKEGHREGERERERERERGGEREREVSV